MKKSLILLTLTASLVYAATPSQHNDAMLLQKAKASADLLLKTLGKNLKMHMKQGGVMDAMNFCNSNALDLTAQVDAKLGTSVSIKRISLKNRNAVNLPSADEQKVLKMLQTKADKGDVLPAYYIEEIAPKHIKYYQPLTINKPVCLKCHGDIKRDSNVGKFLTTHYPSDKATGYKMGDLRGAIVVELED